MKTLIAATVLALTTSAAMAAPSQTAVLRYGDLDLNRSEDAAVMMRRIDSAALSACGASKVSVREMQRAVRAGDCFRDAQARAVATLNAPTVTSLYQEALQVAER